MQNIRRKLNKARTSSNHAEQRNCRPASQRPTPTDAEKMGIIKLLVPPPRTPPPAPLYAETMRQLRNPCPTPGTNNGRATDSPTPHKYTKCTHCAWGWIVRHPNPLYVHRQPSSIPRRRPTRSNTSSRTSPASTLPGQQFRLYIFVYL